VTILKSDRKRVKLIEKVEPRIFADERGSEQSIKARYRTCLFPHYLVALILIRVYPRKSAANFTSAF
jgi:hypothetical protein